MVSPRLHLQLLGLFRLLQDGQPVSGFDQPRLQHLLAYLTLHASPVSRKQLAFVFWPDSTDQQALKNLRTLLTRLRRDLPDADRYFDVTPQTIAWRSTSAMTLDVARFEAMLASAASAQASGDTTMLANALAGAAAVYTGDLLPDCYDDWIVPLRERLYQAYGSALEQLVLLLEEQREYGRALPYAQRLLEHDPLHEPAYGHLMRVHQALGDRSGALRIYRACEAMLQREFGTAPTLATRSLYEHLLRVEDGLSPFASRRPPEADPTSLPLAGRKSEWARLVAAWRAAAQGQPRMLWLTGEPGIGKTRLAEELYAWVARQGVPAAAAQCYARSTALPYAPVAEWLSHPSLQTRLTALDDVWLVEVARVVPAVLVERKQLTTPGPLSEAWQRTRLFEALARAALKPELKRGDRRPVSGSIPRPAGSPPPDLPSAHHTPREWQPPLLLFLDDLQWVDSETLDWLDYLLRFDPGAPLLILATVRSDEVRKDSPLATFRLHLIRSGLLCEITLSPLNAAETAILAASAARREVPATEAARIFQDSEGNPLFVVEAVRAEIGGSSVTPADEQEPGRAKPEPGSLSVAVRLPAKVRAIIQWRLAMLSSAAFSLAQTAAVIGRKFSVPVLAHASDQSEAEVLQALDELWQHQLVRAQGGDTYDFSHDGIRAVAYDDIGPGRLRTLHLRIAKALAKFQEANLDEFSGEIAVHYERAGQMRPAIEFYRRAAAAAKRVYANAEATRLYSHLLEGELGTSLPAREKCEITLELAEVWKVTGRWVRAEKIIRGALVAAEGLGDIGLQAQAQRALADVLHLLGYYDAALEWLSQAERGFTAVGDGRGVVSVLWTIGESYWFRGDHPKALSVLERQLNIASEIGDRRGICEALEMTGMVYWSQGDWESSADCCLRSIRIAGELDYKQVLMRASITLGNIRSSEYWFGEATYWYLQAGLLAREIDDRRLLSWAISNIALVLAKRGDYLRAIAGYESSLRNAWQIGDRRTACLNVAGLAGVNGRLGRLDRAEVLYRKGISLGRRLGIPSYLSGMLLALARFLLARGRALEARELLVEALAEISSVAGERVAGEDTRFEALVLDIRLREALSEITDSEAAGELRAELLREAAPRRQATLRYELWRQMPGDEAARTDAGTYYRSQYAKTGEDECRERYRELTGGALLDPPPLPDVSELIPDQPEDLDLAPLLAELETSFDYAL